MSEEERLQQAEMDGATPWTPPSERGHMVPPPLRVRGSKRPPREVHFDSPDGGTTAWVVLHEWHAILAPPKHSQTDKTRTAIGWYSRASMFHLPAQMAWAAARAWHASGEVLVVLREGSRVLE